MAHAVFVFRCADPPGVVQRVLPARKLRLEKGGPASVRKLVGRSRRRLRVRTEHVLHPFGIRLVVPSGRVENDVRGVLYRTGDGVIAGSGFGEARLAVSVTGDGRGGPAAIVGLVRD